MFVYLFAKVPRPGDSEGIFSIFDGFMSEGFVGVISLHIIIERVRFLPPLIFFFLSFMINQRKNVKLSL